VGSVFVDALLLLSLALGVGARESFRRFESRGGDMSRIKLEGIGLSMFG
jgi:hypothetical protein